jgi:integrase/recombinase XerD
VKHFAAFLGRSPDTATPEELRSYQLQMTNDGVSASTYNVRIISLRFFFGFTCGREEMKRFMQFHRKPRKLPIVLSVEEVADLMAAVPSPGLKYRAALGISYDAGLWAAEVCNLKVKNIDSDRMLIHVDDGKGGRDRKAMLSPSLLDLLHDYFRGLSTRAATAWRPTSRRGPHRKTFRGAVIRCTTIKRPVCGQNE